MAKKSKEVRKPLENIIPLQIHEPRRFFCDRAFIASSEEYFVLAVQTGNIVSAEYAFTPRHMKKLMLRLQEKVAEYEKANGELKVSLPEAE